MKLRRINEAELVAPKVNSTSFAGPDSGAAGMKFQPKSKAPTAPPEPSPKQASVNTPPSRAMNETLALVKSLVKEHINNTLGNLAARGKITKKRSRPLASSKVYGRYKAIREDMDDAEETETRADKEKGMPSKEPEVKKPVEKPTSRRKVPGINLEPENLSVN